MIIRGDCVEVMAEMEEASVDAVVCDPPYGLEFMGKEWDSFKTGRAAAYATGGTLHDPAERRGKGGAGPNYTQRPAKRCAKCGKQAWSGSPCRCDEPSWELDNSPLHAAQDWHHVWATEALRVLKPGGHLLAFGGTRTYHRLACAVEDAGFEIRDCLAYMYGSGFPKSLNVGCRCEDGGSNGEPTTERDLRPVRNVDVPASVAVEDGQGALLLQGVQEPGTSPHGEAGHESSDARPSESRLEGRGDVQAAEGELRQRALHPSTGMGEDDGAQGRLRDGTPAGDGAASGPLPDSDGGGTSPQPRPTGQQARESGAVAGQPLAQDGRGWPYCQRCGKPAAGLGTALKPAHEPIVLARKPLIGTVAGNVLEHGTGALNVDGCRVETDESYAYPNGPQGGSTIYGGGKGIPPLVQPVESHPLGRWPANVLLDEQAAELLDEQSGETSYNPPGRFGTQRVDQSTSTAAPFAIRREGDGIFGYGDTGGASRFYFRAETDPPSIIAGCDHAATAEQSSSPGKPRGASARSDVATSDPLADSALAQATSAPCQASTPSPSEPTPSLNLASDAESQESSDTTPTTPSPPKSSGCASPATHGSTENEGMGVGGDLSGLRFGYHAKASRAERNAGLEGFEEGDGRTLDGGFVVSEGRTAPKVGGPRANHHPTVKPIALMRWLCRLVTPPGGTVLDPFCGSGTTGVACGLEGFTFIGIEREPEYADIAEARIAYWAEHGEKALLAMYEAEARRVVAESGQLTMELA